MVFAGIVGIKANGRREPVLIKRIKRVTHSNDGFVIIAYNDGTTRLFNNFIIV